MYHFWKLLAHPHQEMHRINQKNESLIYHYTHHILLMAAIPVIFTFIGTTQIGWNLGKDHYIKISLITGLKLSLFFYCLILGGVAVMGRIIYWMAHDYINRPSISRCTIFAGYVGTPLFISGVIGLYPLVWLCMLIATLALVYTGYLLYIGIPSFLNIKQDVNLQFSSSILAIGILVFEILLALTIVLWGYGSSIF
ncbi:Yip1 family protein [Pantoea sp. Aalb]|uniref:Yip1 family protein n=1 Tax=Pantoea sp. Aalb TaxID=2576762 RepID=UPI001325A33F|nr:Yip1 family protein [Pantoea sp. Aalb]MXP67515.1 YIP1 family protein [Pantoea sp. Aalb]